METFLEQLVEAWKCWEDFWVAKPRCLFDKRSAEQVASQGDLDTQECEFCHLQGLLHSAQQQKNKKRKETIGLKDTIDLIEPRCDPAQHISVSGLLTWHTLGSVH